MDPILTEDIVPVGEFKRLTARYLRQVSEQSRPVVITQNGRAAAVVVSPANYDALQRRIQLLEDLARSEQDIEAGRTLSTKELRSWLNDRRSQR